MYDKSDVTYNSLITGLNNTRLEILEENLRLSNTLNVSRVLDKVDYEIDSSLMPQIENIYDNLKNDSKYARMLPSFKKHFVIPHKNNNVSILKSVDLRPFVRNRDLALLRLVRFNEEEIEQYILPSPFIGDDYLDKSLYFYAVDYLTDSNSIVVLKQLNYDYLRSSTPVNSSETLDENGDGLINLLFHWFSKHQSLPETFELAFEALFPGWQVRFHVTPGSDITLRIFDGMTELSPTSVPDGFYKLLAILAAVELRPKILLIDELENSLHGRIIEYVVALLKSIDSTVIVTTHSPFVVDSVNIDDLILVERNNHKTTCRRVKNPVKLKEDLVDKGVTVSESWLYSEML